MNKGTPTWEKVAILISALAALIAAFVALYQGFKMRETIQIAYSTNRPFIVIESAAKSSNLDIIVVRAKNTGPIPARILYESGQTWLDQNPLRTGVDSESQHVLYPNETVVLSQIVLDNPEAVLNGERNLKIGDCILYESVSPDDQRRWVSESWFYFNPNNNKICVWKRDETTAKKSNNSCSVDSLIPTDLFKTQLPPWQQVRRNNFSPNI